MTRRSALVVDDDAHVLEVLEMRLEALGFDVTASADPQAAIQILSRRGFDVALFDLRMAPIDGIALTRAAHEKQSRLPAPGVDSARTVPPCACTMLLTIARPSPEPPRVPSACQ